MLNRLSYFITDFKIFIFFGVLILILNLICLVKIRRLHSRQANIYLSIIAILTTLSTAFIIGEAYLRYGYDLSDGIGFLKVNQKWHARHVIFNSNFRRDREFLVSKTPNEFRIGVIGDSIAFGMGVEKQQDRFSDILENKLREHNVNATVYNLGMSGVDTNAEIDAFKKMQHLRFDMLIWEYYLNDANSASTSANAQITRVTREKVDNIPIIGSILRTSYFADFLFWRLTTIYDQTYRSLVNEDLRLYDDAKIFPGHAAQISEFLAYLTHEQIPVVVAVFPLLHSESIRQQSAAYYQKMLKVFEDGGATAVVDLNHALQDLPVDRLKSSRFDHHPNELVHQITAQLLFQRTMEIIPSQTKSNIYEN